MCCTDLRLAVLNSEIQDATSKIGTSEARVSYWKVYHYRYMILFVRDCHAHHRGVKSIINHRAAAQVVSLQSSWRSWGQPSCCCVLALMTINGTWPWQGQSLPSRLLEHATGSISDLLARVSVDRVAGLLGEHAEG